MHNTMSFDERMTLDSYGLMAEDRMMSQTDPYYWSDAFQQFRQFLPSGSVVDLGCGVGRDALLFNCSSYDYRGVDGCQEMIDLAKMNMPCAKFSQLNMYDLSVPEASFLDGSFDGFWAVCSLIHVKKRHVPDVLSGVSRVVKENGVGFIVMREGQGEVVVEDFGLPRMFYLYSQGEFSDVLRCSGFDVLSQYFDERGKLDFTKGYMGYFVRNHKLS